METKWCGLLCGLLMYFPLVYQQQEPGECTDYRLKNDFKNISIKICGNKLYYYEKDYDIGPFRDTCEVKFRGKNIVIKKSATDQFWYKRIYYGKEKKSVFVVFMQSLTKTKKLEIPVVN